jgi:mono/diheme cytochrome c family protein
MKSLTLLGALGLVAAAAVAGCYTGGSVDVNGTGTGAPAITSDPTLPVAGDLPCDLVQALTSCASCHGSPLSGGAPNRLLTYDDLAGPSRSDPAQSVAQLSVARMKNAKSPMPPSGVAPATDTAVLEKWIADGMPKGTCGGATGSAGYDTPSVCTSGTTYTRGHSTKMRPGGACNGCHASDEGPIYGIAGTVYATAHEPDNCNGSSDPNVRVVITDANGQDITLSVNSAGNFVYPARVATPYTAKIVNGAKTRLMVGPQTDGDCNGCHTEQGTSKAPGRIMIP